MRRWLAGLLVGSIVFSLAPDAAAADGRKATLTRKVNSVQVRKGGRGAWRAATLRMVLGTGDEIRTTRASAAELTYGDGTVTRLGPNTTIAMRSSSRGRGLKVWFGRLWMRVAKGTGGMNVRTPAAVAAVTGTDLYVFHEGTETAQTGKAMQVAAGPGSFQLAADEKLSRIGLLEGGVEVRKETGGFDTADLYNPSVKGIWIASTAPGFTLAQDFGGSALNPGQEFKVTPTSPPQIDPIPPGLYQAATQAFNSMGINPSWTQPGNANSDGKDSKSGDGKSGDGKSGDGKAGDGKAGDGKAGDGKSGDGKAAGSGDGKSEDNKSGGGNAGGNSATNDDKNDNDNRSPGDANNDKDSTAGGVDPKAGGDTGTDPTPGGVTDPTAGGVTPDAGTTDPNGGADPTAGGTTPDAGTNPDTGTPPPPPPPPPAPEPAQNTMDNLIRPVDKSPTTGDLEIIIR